MTRPLKDSSKPAFCRIDVRGCARCGVDHPQLLHFQFERPVAPPELDFAWEYWAPCPTTGDPILTAILFPPVEEAP